MVTDRRHRVSTDIVSSEVSRYFRFNVSNRDIEDLLAERGIAVSYESMRPWCIRFDARYSRRLKHQHRGYGVAHLGCISIGLSTLEVFGSVH